MTEKSSIKTCHYKYCKHEPKTIDITKDDFVSKGNAFYHKDCYKAKQNGEWKDKETKKDLQFIKTLWVENISNTVVYSQLMRTLNNLLERGVESKYLVFVMQYCIDHKLNLRYPNGFYYFVDNEQIKKAYTKKKLLQNGFNNSLFIVTDQDNKSPQFSVNKKTNGFQSILKGNK